jgi:hypothetical protein
MRVRLLPLVPLVALALCADVAPGFATEVSWPAKVGPWTALPTSVKAAAEINRLEGENPILKESGFVSASPRTYRNGNSTADVILYTFRDSSGAYEAYTVLQAAESPIKIFNIAVPRGNLVLWIRSEVNFASAELAVLETWEQSLSDGVPSPPVATYLPEKDRQPLTELYALGPVGFSGAIPWLWRAEEAALVEQVGFNSGAEAMFAEYRSGTQKGLLLLIEYPTPQLAELHLHHLQAALAANPKLASTSVERKGSLLSIVLVPTSAAYAARLRNAVNYETQVTWNEASQTATDPPITSTLVKIITGTGVIMVMAVVFGVAFGGLRVITKRIFPGKVFDRPERMEVLQLGLSSKPIDPRDLY